MYESNLSCVIGYPHTADNMDTTKPLLCTLPPPWDGPHPLVMSHRAGGNEAPENTLAALRSAEAAGSRVSAQMRAHAGFKKWELWCGIVYLKHGNVPQVMQMDVLPTLDGTPVIFHDINMKRATGQDIDIRQVCCWPRMLWVSLSTMLRSMDAQTTIKIKSCPIYCRCPQAPSQSIRRSWTRCCLAWTRSPSTPRSSKMAGGSPRWRSFLMRYKAASERLCMHVLQQQRLANWVRMPLTGWARHLPAAGILGRE